MEKIQKLLTDEEFVKKVVKCETESEVKDLFSDKGVELDDNQMKELKTLFSEIAKELNELEPEELEKAAGGTDEFISKANLTSWQTLVGLAVGVIGGASVGYKASGEEDSKAKKAIKIIGGALAGGAALGAAGAGVKWKWFND